MYDVPDFFDGTLKIMAVGVSNETAGAADRDTLIRGPFIVTPSMPVLAAPGDEFEAGMTAANNVEGSGSDAEIELHAETSAHLSIMGASTQKLRIGEGREQSASLRFHVNETLGPAEVRFVARRNGIETRRRARSVSGHLFRIQPTFAAEISKRETRTSRLRVISIPNSPNARLRTRESRWV